MLTSSLPPLEGTLSLRTLAMPADTNPAGDIFGGWLLSQMDIAGGLAAKKLCHSRVVTVGIDAMTFHKPVFVGDVVCCYTDVTKIGNTSLTVKVQVWSVRDNYSSERILVTEGLFTYVAIDEHRQPKQLALPPLPAK